MPPTSPTDSAAGECTSALLLDHCHVEEPIRLDEAELPSIRLRDCHLWGLHARQLRTRGDVDLVRTTSC